MEPVKVKNEESGRRRSMSCAADVDQAQAAKGVKRRRRDPTPVAALGGDDNNQSQHQQQFPPQQMYQTSTVTTVKRSSKFRGVSMQKYKRT